MTNLIIPKMNENYIIQDIPIGYKFKRMGRKHPRIETVTDVHKTYNLAGDLVKTTYVTEHEFMGQTITDSDVCKVTIQRGEQVTT